MPSITDFFYKIIKREIKLNSQIKGIKNKKKKKTKQHSLAKVSY